MNLGIEMNSTWLHRAISCFEPLREICAKLVRARTFLFIIIPLLVSAVAAMCLLEVWYLGYLQSSFVDLRKFSTLFISALVMLLLLSVTLAVLCLHLTEAAQAAGLAETAVFLLLGVAYASIPRQSLIQPLVFLATGKVLGTILFARFWHAKFRVFRMRFRDTPSAHFYLSDFRRFMGCKWVVLGSWLISILAFTLALVVSQTVLELQGWEGLVLLLTFFALFWIFVRNPYAHEE